jgi:hypothetical protein
MRLFASFLGAPTILILTETAGKIQRRKNFDQQDYTFVSSTHLNEVLTIGLNPDELLALQRHPEAVRRTLPNVPLVLLQGAN